MYESFFGFQYSPFTLTPNPASVYFSPSHTEAFHHLLYALDRGEGFAVLTGEVGLGKTTLLRALMRKLEEKADIALILNSRLTTLELLKTICTDLEVPVDRCRDKADFLRTLNDSLLEKQNVILFIDDAHALPAEIFEEIRLLTNLESDTRKLLQVVLAGQPELETLLNNHELRPLRHRVTCWYRLKPLDLTGTRNYVAHRLHISEPSRPPQFSESAIKTIHRYSRGAPRRINMACDRALLAAYTAGTQGVTRKMVKEGISAIEGKETRWGQGSWVPAPWAGLIGLFSLCIAGIAFWLPGSVEAPMKVNASAKVESASLTMPVPAPQPLPKPPWEQCAEAVGLKSTLSATGKFSFLPQPGYFAYEASWPLERVTKFGVPGVIIDIEKEPSVLALLERDGIQWKVWSGRDEPRWIGFAALEAVYPGKVLLVWKEPALSGETLTVGVKGPQVAELARCLHILGFWEGEGNEYSVSLGRGVKKFQEAAGIHADGIAGRETILALASELEKIR